MAAVSPLPDWEKTCSALVDAACWKAYSSPPCDLRQTVRELAGALKDAGTTCVRLGRDERPVDIWIRDWGPVEGCYFQYDPRYARPRYSRAAVATARKHLNRCCSLRPTNVPLVLDGGNLVHNGSVAIVTDAVLRHNRQFSVRQIESMILSLGFQQLVFIPSPPGDTIAHTDGILRFIRRDTILVNSFEQYGFRRYGRALRRLLTRAVPDCHLVMLPWFDTGECVDGIYSAAGTYVNFVQTRHLIAYPTFGHPFDEAAGELIARLSSSPVRPIAASSLARLGGVLNCIVTTW